MVYTNIYPKNHPNVGKYTIHGAYGIQFTGSFYGCFTCPGHVKTSPTDFPDFVTQDFSYTFGEFPHRTVNVYRRVVDMLWDTYIYIHSIQRYTKYNGIWYETYDHIRWDMGENGPLTPKKP
jgi:hypothetical protein